MRAHRVFLAAVSALCLLSLTACSDSSADEFAATAAPSQTPPPVTKVAVSEFPTYIDASSEVTEGARLFGYKRCAECHSDAGIMLGAGDGNIDKIATAIRDGRPGGMPAYAGKLTDAQIWQIAAFVKALDARGPTDGETVRMDMDLTAAQ